MQVVEVHIPPTVITGPADDMDRPRSPGLHLSQIYNDLDSELSADKAKRKAAMVLGQLQVYRSAGFIWERAMEIAMANALASDEWVRPQEFVQDGISGSPDLISLARWQLGETKYTWRSSRGLQELIDTGTGPFWVWLVQMKGYCHLINSLESRLFAFFVNGNYKNGYVPEWRVLDFTFTPLEIRENWDMLKNHAHKKGWL